MGVKLSWIAVREVNYSKINSILELSDMTLLGIARENQYKEQYKNNEFNGRMEAFLTQKGWYFIMCRYLPFFIEEKLHMLSKETTLVIFELTETAMSAKAEYWFNSEKIWSLSHNPNEGIFNLEENGILPDSFRSIKEKIFAEQNNKGGVNAKVDCIIEIPSLMASEVTGYKHDEGFVNKDKIIESTESVLSRKKPSLLLKEYI